MRYAHVVFSGLIAALSGAAVGAAPLTDVQINDGAIAASARIADKPPRDYPDVRLASDPKMSETAWSVAVHPTNPARVLAAIERTDCVILASADAGKTWKPAVKLPVAAGQVCSLPAVAYAPDGSRAFAVYARSLAAGCFSYDCPNDILFSTSENDGRTWSAPTMAIHEADANVFVDAPALAVPSATTDRQHLYIVARPAYGVVGQFRDVVFAWSADGGRIWSKPRKMASFDRMEGGATDYSVAGGTDGHVVVAWNYFGPRNPSRIITQSSRDFGRTFETSVVAVEENAGTLFGPDVKIDGEGMAHIAYGIENSNDQGSRIRYVYSRALPYQKWSSPVTLDEGGPRRARGAPALAVENCGPASLLHVAWMGNRRGPNMDVFYTRGVTGPGRAWSTNIRVSDAPSPGSEKPYKVGLAAGGGAALAIWSHRIDTQNDLFDVYGSRIASGVSCPRAR